MKYEKLSALIYENGLTKKFVAQQLDYDTSYINERLRKVEAMPGYKLKTLAKLLNVTIENLLED